MSALTSAPTTQSDRWRPLTMMRELGMTVSLCYFITLGLLQYTSRRLRTARYVRGAERLGFLRVPAAFENVSHAELLKVTTGCSVAAFAMLELCILRLRREISLYRSAQIYTSRSARYDRKRGESMGFIGFVNTARP
ncbi:hypothetical protein C8J57DRAFT_1253754 [Mycena rebaudengoi]|nr:hypothetical protein C8J57DRAFT_1253754 [Mycena rebaudengoi]